MYEIRSSLSSKDNNGLELLELESIEKVNHQLEWKLYSSSLEASSTACGCHWYSC